MIISEKNNLRFKVTGPNKLTGTLSINGAKNAALKMIAASVLSDQTVTIHNVPNILDIYKMLEIINLMGARVEWLNTSTLQINCSNLKSVDPDPKLVGNLRASVILIGPLLARFGQVKIHLPGGCKIGARSIETHIDGFKQLGVHVTTQGKFVTFKSPKKMTSKEVNLMEFSVTATENIILFASNINETIHLNLGAIEPEITNLVELLVQMGAKFEGVGTYNLTINGKKYLKGGEVTVIPDRIEAATYMFAAVSSRGKITICDVIPEHLRCVLNVLVKMGVKISILPPKNNLHDIFVDATGELKAHSIDTRPYPGFATDLQSPFAVVATQAKGKTQIFETLFEGRFEYIKSLQKMGAKIHVKSDHIIEITGPTKLNGQNLSMPDLRGGAALVMAANIASGDSMIENSDIVERGYQNFAEKLNLIGAQVERIL